MVVSMGVCTCARMRVCTYSCRCMYVCMYVQYVHSWNHWKVEQLNNGWMVERSNGWMAEWLSECMIIRLHNVLLMPRTLHACIHISFLSPEFAALEDFRVKVVRADEAVGKDGYVIGICQSPHLTAYPHVSRPCSFIACNQSGCL